MLHFLTVLVFDNTEILQKCPEILTVFFEILLLSGKNDLLSERVYQNLRLDK
ncbi:cell filamentation protein Fic [Streptococcus periodonticum]|uniref:Cell filamentation protein Fic n=1 Tax=Streptococcus periodonticum TaxID=2490633 RepID=A0A3S9MQ50_9STRE|nr:cell filamentation protein Fic [Streptococcus periodonticum]